MKIQNFYLVCNTFNIEGINSEPIYNYFIKKRILSSITKKETSEFYFKKNKIKSSTEYQYSYNTFYEIDYLIKCLIDLIQK